MSDENSVGVLMEEIMGVMDQQAEERHVAQMAEVASKLLGHKPGEARNPLQLGSAEPTEDGEAEARATPPAPRVFVNDEMDRAFEQFAEPQVRAVMKPADVYYGQRYLQRIAQRDQVGVLRIFAEWESHSPRLIVAAAGAKGAFTGGLWQGQSASVIPVPLQRAIEISRQDGGVMRGVCRNLDISEGGTLRYPVSTISTAVMTAEGTGPAGHTGPNAGQIILTAKKMTWDGEATEEFLADSAINVVNWFTQSVGEAFGAQEDSQVIASTGLGAAFTRNIRSNAVSSTTCIDTTNNLVQYADVTRLLRAVPKMYRRRRSTAFMGDSTVLGWLEELVGNDGHPILKPRVNADLQTVGDAASPQPMGTILGRPVWEVPVPAGILLCGPTDMYALGTVRGGMTMRATDTVKWEEDGVSFKARQRLDGTPFFSEDTVIAADAKNPIAELTGILGPKPPA